MSIFTALAATGIGSASFGALCQAWLARLSDLRKNQLQLEAETRSIQQKRNDQSREEIRVLCARYLTEAQKLHQAALNLNQSLKKMRYLLALNSPASIDEMTEKFSGIEVAYRDQLEAWSTIFHELPLVLPEEIIVRARDLGISAIESVIPVIQDNASIPLEPPPPSRVRGYGEELFAFENAVRRHLDHNELPRAYSVDDVTELNGAD